MQVTLFDSSVSITGTEEIIFTKSLSAYIEYPQISFKITEACFVSQSNKKCICLTLPL